MLLYILSAVILHVAGHYLLVWSSGKSVKSIRSSSGWFRWLFELSGILANLLFAFILMLIISVCTTEEYLPIENLKYGLKFSETAKELGFKDGDHITSIDGKEIDRFSEIMREILLAPDLAEVTIQRGDSLLMLKLSSQDRSKFFTDTIDYHVLPIWLPPSGEYGDTIKIHKERQGLEEAWGKYSSSVNRIYTAIRVIIDQDYVRHVEAFYFFEEPEDIRDHLSYIAIYSLWIAVFNLTPLPGLDIGNALIIQLERITGNSLEGITLSILRICFAVIVIGLGTFLLL